MKSLRDNNRLPHQYPWRETMAQLAANNYRMAAGPHTMIATTRNGGGFRLFHYDTLLAVAYEQHAYVTTGGRTTRPTADRLDRIVEQYGWECVLLTHRSSVEVVVSHGNDDHKTHFAVPSDTKLLLDSNGQLTDQITDTDIFEEGTCNGSLHLS